MMKKNISTEDHVVKLAYAMAESANTQSDASSVVVQEIEGRETYSLNKTASKGSMFARIKKAPGKMFNSFSGAMPHPVKDAKGNIKKVVPSASDQAKTRQANAATILQLSGLGVAGALGLKMLLARIQNNSKRTILINDLLRTNAIIKGGDKQRIMGWYATLVQVAPRSALDKTVVTEVLEGAVRFNKLDVATINMLAKMENEIVKKEPITNLKALTG